jgi:hypothetical protein
MNTPIQRQTSPMAAPGTQCKGCVQHERCADAASGAAHPCPRAAAPQGAGMTRRQVIFSGARTVLGTAVGAGALLGAVGCSDEGEITAPDQAAPAELARALARNSDNQRIFDALVAELEPHLRKEPDGTWTVDPDAPLSPSARAFMEVASREMKEAVATGERIDTGAAFLRLPTGDVGPNYNGIRWYWWGVRISISSANVGALANAVRMAGVGGAVQFFVQALLAPAWVVSIVPLLVAYWMAVIAAINARGGRRGVHIYVTWATLIFVQPQ